MKRRARLEWEAVKSLFSSRDLSHTSSVKLEQAKANYEAAVRLWPRNDRAIDQAWRVLFGLRCEQLRRELGQ
jgi:hypothetical protein